MGGGRLCLHGEKKRIAFKIRICSEKYLTIEKDDAMIAISKRYHMNI